MKLKLGLRPFTPNSQETDQDYSGAPEPAWAETLV